MATKKSGAKKGAAKKGTAKQVRFKSVQLELTDEQRQTLQAAFGSSFVKKLEGILVTDISGNMQFTGMAN